MVESVLFDVMDTEWLDREMREVKSRKFFLIEGPLAPLDAVIALEGRLPPSYSAFRSKYGNISLYRKGSGYLIEVYNTPSLKESRDGVLLLRFGRTRDSQAYFKPDELLEGKEAPVYEWSHGAGLRKRFDGFESWLRSKCQKARTEFSKDDWNIIRDGPAPFSVKELEVLEARRAYQWKLEGIAADGDLIFSVHNFSQIVLPFLTIGVRSACGKIDGAVWLPVDKIPPGGGGVVKKDCYKNIVSPNSIEAYEKPDPIPEERDRYWEFGGPK